MVRRASVKGQRESNRKRVQVETCISEEVISEDYGDLGSGQRETPDN